jgi:hypothetical protein
MTCLKRRCDNRDKFLQRLGETVMENYRHKVAGIYMNPEKAEHTLNRLLDQGLPREQLLLLHPEQAPAVGGDADNETLKNMLVDGAIGTAVGTGAGALAEVALVAAHASLFIASPLVASLAMLGWGAGVGGIVGALAGAEKSGVTLSEAVSNALKNGNVVLLAQTTTKEQTAAAQQVIRDSVKDGAGLPGT